MDEYDKSKAVLAMGDDIQPLEKRRLAIFSRADAAQRITVKFGDGKMWSLPAVPGESCPTCGHSVPMTGAQRTRKYRERRAKRADRILQKRRQ